MKTSILVSLTWTILFLVKFTTTCPDVSNNDCFENLRKSVFWANNTRQAFITKIKDVTEDVFFYHYKNGDTGTESVMTPMCEDCLSNYIPNGPLIILCHGWTAGPGTFRGYLSKIRALGGEYNVITVDWAKLAEGKSHYDRAVNNVAVVGTYVACFMKWLIGMKYVALEDIHFIGHSLGAQVANHVAQTLNHKCEDKEYKIGRITGLDPAWPLIGFHDSNTEWLDKSDALFVDVIHTCHSICLLGFRNPVGHIDFYPNGGQLQPGCSGIPCAHNRAVELFEHSISKSTERFIGCKCILPIWWMDAFTTYYTSNPCLCFDATDDPTIMGWNTPKTSRGVFYLRTTGSAPFYVESGYMTSRRKENENEIQTDYKHRKISVLAV